MAITFDADLPMTQDLDHSKALVEAHLFRGVLKFRPGRPDRGKPDWTQASNFNQVELIITNVVQIRRVDNGIFALDISTNNLYEALMIRKLYENTLEIQIKRLKIRFPANPCKYPDRH